MSKTIAFFGTEEFSAVSLRRLIDDGFSISAVITKPDSKKGRGKKMVPSAVKILAEEYKIPVWQPGKLADIVSDIKSLDDPIGVLVSYGKIIPQSVIDLFSPGIVNVHPSLLPKYRGPSPIETAILNGDDKTGISIMQLSADMDAGPVYDQLEIGLDGNETAPQLEKKLAKLGAERLSALLPEIISGRLIPVEQDSTEASYCSLLSKKSSQLHPSEMTADQAERQVRAYLTFPKTKIEVLGQQIVITKASVVDNAENDLCVAFSDGKFLKIEQLVGPSGRLMTATDFLNGYSR